MELPPGVYPWARRYPWLKVRHFRGADDDQFRRTWVEALLDAFALAFGESWPYVSGTENPDAHVRSARTGVSTLIDWVCSLPCGTTGLKSLKELSAWWRRVSVHDRLVGVERPPFLPTLPSVFRGCLSLDGYTSNERARKLFQLSRFARAGPGPLPCQVSEAKLQHKLDLTRRFRVARATRRSLRNFARIWARKKLEGLAVSFPQSTSATYESSRAKGGLTEQVRSAVQQLKGERLTYALAQRLVRVCSDLEYQALPEGTIHALGVHDEHEEPELVGDLLFPYLEDYLFLGVGPQEWEVLREHLYGYAAMCIRMDSRLGCGELPAARQAAVEERGMKVRIVTPVSADVTYVSSVINSLLLRMMVRDPRLNPKSSTPLLDGLGRFSTVPGLIARSVDLTRASDLIPHEVALSLVEGLCDGAGWSPFLKQAFRLAAGPHILRFDDGSTAVTSGGILMGSGVTWPLLSLYNLWLWEGAWTSLGRATSESLIRRRVRIVGDDLLGVAPLEVSQQYTRRLVATGGSPSWGKDLLSREYGVLVEELAHLDALVPSHLPTISVRSLQPTSRVERDGSVVPSWAYGPALGNLWEKHGRPGWLLTAISDRYARDIEALRHHGLNPLLPREFGGGGFPSKDDGRSAIASLRPKWARALRCAMSQSEVGVALMSSLQTVWSDRFESVLHEGVADFWRRASADSFVPGGGEGEELGDDHPTRAQCCEAAVAAVEAAMRLVAPSRVRARHLTPRRVRKDLERRIERLNALVPYPRLTDRPSDLANGLERWLLANVRARVHKASLLPVVESSSAHLVGAWFAPE